MRFMVIGAVVGVILTCLVGWRILDHLLDRSEVARLRDMQPAQPLLFQHEMISDLPEPARRFFRYAIEEGTPLRTVVTIQMNGQFSLGDKKDPHYMSMQASQILAAPDGFVWKMRARSGHLRLSGSDSGTWTRFWMGGLLPVARAGGDADHARSAFGRMVAEAVFWAPAAVLPSQHISWEPIDQETVRMTVRYKGMEQSVELSVAPDGQLTQVTFQRWSNANPDNEYRLQPFGGYLWGFQDFRGYRLPTHVEAGNHFGTDTYFPFFVIDVSEITFPEPKN